MTEPPNKRIKAGQEFMDLINECFDLKFNRRSGTTEDEKRTLSNGIQTIRETLEQTTNSSDVSFGSTRTSAKINWGKCLGILLEDDGESSGAIGILTNRLNPGGGLL